MSGLLALYGARLRGRANWTVEAWVYMLSRNLYGARLRKRAKWILTLVKVGSCLPEFTSRPLALLTIPELGPNCAYFSCLAGVGSAFKERPPGSPTVSGSYQRRQVAGAAPVNGRFWPSTVAQWVGCERQQRVLTCRSSPASCAAARRCLLTLAMSRLGGRLGPIRRRRGHWSGGG